MENAPCAIRSILCPDDTIMHLNNSLTNGQAKSKATDFPSESHINAVKTIKDTFEMINGNTHTIIAHKNFQHVSRNLHCLLIIFRFLNLNRLDLYYRAKYDLYDTTTRRELDCVLEQIIHDFPHKTLVSQYEWNACSRCTISKFQR